MSHSNRTFSATDLVDFLTCPRKLLQNLEMRDGPLERPPRDELGEFITAQGLEHENRVREDLAQKHGPFEQIEGADPASRAAATLDEMKRGAAVIDQGELLAPPWMGRPDFLLRVDGGTASRFGPYHYEPLEAKLAKRARGEAVTQLTHYALLLGVVQGVFPARMHIELGSQESESFSTRDFAAYVRAGRERLLAWIRTAPTVASVYPEPVPACRHCDWLSTCDDIRRRDDHVAFVGGASAVQLANLRAANVATMTALAQLADTARVPGVDPHAVARLSEQARLQIKRGQDQKWHTQLLPDADRGFHMLPPAAPGDVFVSLETDGLAVGGALTYLWGWLEDAETATPTWKFGWAHDRTREQHALETFVDSMTALYRRHRAMHIYHYGAAVLDTLEAMAGRYATRQRELDHLVRNGVLVDLSHVLRRTVVMSTESYALADVEPAFAHLNPPRDSAVMDGASATLRYHSWQDSQEDRWLRDLEQYNEAECLALRGLRNWLLELRDQHGGAAYVPVADRETDTPWDQVESLLRSPDPGLRTLGHLLQYPWREERSTRTTVENRKRATAEELYSDPEAIANLTWPGPASGGAAVCQFDPSQPLKLAVGSELVIPGVAHVSGQLLDLDLQQGLATLTESLARRRPSHVVSAVVVGTSAIVSALARVASTWTTGHGQYAAARHVLDRTPPRLRTLSLSGPALPEDLVERAQVLAADLQDSYLAVQGPPGTGKTFLAAAVVGHLLAQGKTVGVTGPSHKAIGNLLEAVGAAAPAGRLAGVQKASSGQGASVPGLAVVNDNHAIVRAIRSHQVNLVAGTAWLFARDDMDQALDYLVIDEAGQVPLAYAVAAATAAKNLILVGDPQQLQQPVVAVHPRDIDRSALGHIVGVGAVMADNLGLFMAVTRRMHPRIANFISQLAYEGRLGTLPGLERQHLVVAGAEVAGLWYVPVPSPGVSFNASREEALTVKVLVAALLEGEWSDAAGQRRPLTPADILVVAPFNAHVNLLAQVLGEPFRVGTVDKFQGQEAPVVIYTTAAAAADRIPHGEQFLLNVNRLNVALSRARALAVLVANPALLATKPLDSDPLRVVNALCALAEQAEPLPAAVATRLKRALPADPERAER